MADYYPLIARAVAGLDKSTGEARRALYERARTALVTQLRGVEPALTEGDITRERLALEDAIRKVEAEAARRPREEPPDMAANVPPPMPRFDKPSTFAPAPPPPPAPEVPPRPGWDDLHRELDDHAPPREGSAAGVRRPGEPETPAYTPGANEPPLSFDPEPWDEPKEQQTFVTSPIQPPEPPAEEEPPSREPLLPPRRVEQPPAVDRPSLVDQGLKGFRDVMSESRKASSSAAPAAKPARELTDLLASLNPGKKPESLEPPLGIEDFKPMEEPPPERADKRAGRRRGAAPRPAEEGLEELQTQRLRSGRSVLPKIVALLAVLVLLGGGAFAYHQWGSNLTALFQSKAPTTQASREAPQARPKISDRVGGAQQDSAARPSAPGAAVAQRAILYEQGATPQERKEYVGSVIWRTENVSPGPGQPADVAIKAEVEIPERHMRMSFIIRRNLDQALPASHTVEIVFSTPPDFDAGGVADVPGVLMEDNDQRRGMPLAGTRVKVTAGFFLVGLSAVESDMRRNIQLLKDRSWVHIRIAYNNGRSALLAIEKGVPGDRVIEEALTAWGQMPPSQAPQQ